MSSSLCIIYHRQPYEERVENGRVTYHENKSPNGIVPTLKSFFAHVDKGQWVAWKQLPKSKVDQANFERRVRFSDSHGSYDVVRLGLSADEVKSFYHVTSKEAFWPILHSFPWQANFSNVDWETFVDVNRKFAEAACEQADDDTLFWVHDYNLWLVPGFIRKMKPNARIAFFHHTPFPSSDVFNILPWRDDIIDSLLACDVVGFHIARYAQNFVATARSLRDVDVTERTQTSHALSPVGNALSEDEVVTCVRHQGRDVRIDAMPVGTNPALIRELLATDKSRALQKEIRERLDGQRLIVSVGRVDYTKGTREMLESYERLLERRPDLHGQVKLLVTSVSAARGMTIYKNARRSIEQLVGRINGRFSRLNWSPILLFTTAVPFDELLAYYREADICWTTPLRDGLNLVAKEFVAAHQDRGGVLVLSEFTGVAVELDSAVMCNPYHDQDMDAAIERALDMSHAEQQVRMRRMTNAIETYDIEHWAEHCAQQFAKVGVDAAITVDDGRSVVDDDDAVDVTPDDNMTTLLRPYVVQEDAVA